ncbi:hypothetical protein ACLOJK_039413 [Asimina triloba]
MQPYKPMQRRSHGGGALKEETEDMAEKQQQLIVAVEGTAAIGPFWQAIVTDYLDKIISFNDLNVVVSSIHNVACLVQRSAWTRDVDVFFQWLSALRFSGGGFGEAAIAEGLAEALMMFSVPANGSQTQPNIDGQKHCILVAASNPYTLPTPVSKPTAQNLEKNDSLEAQSESFLADAETLAKSFPQVVQICCRWFPSFYGYAVCLVSLSVISPKQLPKLRAIYHASLSRLTLLPPKLGLAFRASKGWIVGPDSAWGLSLNRCLFEVGRLTPSPCILRRMPCRTASPPHQAPSSNKQVERLRRQIALGRPGFVDRSPLFVIISDPRLRSHRFLCPDKAQPLPDIKETALIETLMVDPSETNDQGDHQPPFEEQTTALD